MNQIRAVIFDFDGLIIDTETPLFEIWQEVYRECGCELELTQWQKALGTLWGFDPFDDLERRGVPPLDRSAVLERTRVAHRARCSTEPLLPGILDRLQEAKDLSLGIAVASSSSASWVTHWLEQHDLVQYPDVILGREDVAAVKPAPDLFLLAAERLKIPQRHCLVFEDSANGSLAARAAGMKVIAIPNRLTASSAFPPVDLRAASLADIRLVDLIHAFD